jgi:hypothetical protein
MLGRPLNEEIGVETYVSHLDVLRAEYLPE